MERLRSRRCARRPPGHQICIVPFCGRTRRDDGKYAEWVCTPHWRLAEPAARRVYKHRLRSTTYSSSAEQKKFVDMMWLTLKAQVLDRAMAIGPI